MKRKKHGLITSRWILCALLLISTFLPQIALAIEAPPTSVVKEVHDRPQQQKKLTRK